MKKVLFIAVVAVASLASCKKDRVCTCVVTSNAPGSVSTTEVKTYQESKKGFAKENCYSYTEQTTAPVSGYIETHTCELK